MLDALHNRAFLRGFQTGFSSPFRLMSGSRPRVTYTPHATDAEAWEAVGRLLNEAYQEVGTEVGKTTRAKKSPRARR